MKRQNDWFTGIDYYHSHREKEITIEEKTVIAPTEKKIHEQVEMLYVLSGRGVLSINGYKYIAKEGSFFCMYSHHFYNIESVEKKLHVVFIKFYIGLFMYMSWEKHPKNANARLMYDTSPLVNLEGQQKEKIKGIVLDIIQEKENRRFGSMNMIEYKTLELHTYFCRYAYERINLNQEQENEVWKIIKKIILTTSKNLSLEEISEEKGCAPRILNRNIKEACGYTFFQLQQFGKIINACALLHFPELSMEYISHILGFSSVNSFYRFFLKYCSVTPRDYQKKCIGNENAPLMATGLAMQFLQYMHMNFMRDLSLESICREFCIKEYSGKEIFEHIFGGSFNDVLNEIRVCYASSLLRVSDFTILEISFFCGFDSLSTFQRTFKTYMNQTPGEYRHIMKYETL